MLRWLFVCACAGCCLLALHPVAEAQKKDAAKEQEQKAEETKAQYINDLMTAYRLADIGRDKDNPAPEALVTAAAILRRLASVKVKSLAEKPEIKNTEGAADAKGADEVVPPPDLKAEANNLLEGARDAAALANLAYLKPLIKAVEECEDEADARAARQKTRHVFGGPRQVTRLLGPLQSQTYNLKAQPNSPLVFALRATIPVRITIVRPDVNHVWANDVVPIAQRTCHPGGATRSNLSVPVIIQITNVSRLKGQYVMFVN
jgi:hypothetical protein